MKRVESRLAGFTLVELMIVIAIIAILASIAIPQYLKYQRKSKVTTYALPTVRACSMDVVTYCLENPGSYSITPVGNSSFPNCNSPISTPVGDLTLSSNGFVCSDNGSLTSGALTGTLAGITDYKAECTITGDGNLKCTVAGQ